MYNLPASSSCLPEKNSFQAGKTDKLLVNNNHTTWHGPPSIENFVWRLFLPFLHSPLHNLLCLGLGKGFGSLAFHKLSEHFHQNICVEACIISVSKLALYVPFLNSFLLISLPSIGSVKFSGVSSFTRVIEPLFSEG